MVSALSLAFPRRVAVLAAFRKGWVGGAGLCVAAASFAGGGLRRGGFGFGGRDVVVEVD